MPENCCSEQVDFGLGEVWDRLQSCDSPFLLCHLRLAQAHSPRACAKGQGKVVGCIWGITFGGSCPSGLG